MKNSTKNFIKKLDDASLENVSGGGIEIGDVVSGVGIGTVALSVVSGIGCGIADTVCQYKAKSKRDQGDIRSAEKLEKAGRVLGPVSLGVGVGGTVVGAVMAVFGFVAVCDDV